MRLLNLFKKGKSKLSVCNGYSIVNIASCEPKLPKDNKIAVIEFAGVENNLFPDEKIEFTNKKFVINYILYKLGFVKRRYNSMIYSANELYEKFGTFSEINKQ